MEDPEMRAAIVAVLAMSLGACAASATNIPMKGKDTDVVQLAGEWEGSYTGTDSGRTGDIRFHLGMGRHTADGEVIFGATGMPLKVSFVQVANGQVSGTMAPYKDPVCECEVETEFFGTVDGDQIDGTFTSHVTSMNMTQRGSWKVVRSGS
jgi:hypothetical protein